MKAFKRPLGLIPLLLTFATLVLLTAMLASMVWKRIALLQNGQEVVLKTAPVDPRDLLRGYYVRLSYDISRINIHDLPDSTNLQKGFRRHMPIYVTLRPGEDGFWSAVAVHHTMPAAKPALDSTSRRTITIRGRVRYANCPTRRSSGLRDKCEIFIRYGIEKFFAQKSRARKLEDFSRQTSAQIDQLNRQIRARQKTYRKAVEKARRKAGNENGTNISRKIPDDPKLREMSEEINRMRRRLAVLERQNRQTMAKRFAVIVRIDQNSGEAAISGLQLDGRRIYEERLY